MSSLYQLCKQYGIADEQRRPFIDIYVKFMVAGLSADFESFLILLFPYLNGVNMDGLIEGRIVHYVMPNGKHRPAIVVHNLANELTPPCEGYVNLTVFTDWENDFNSMPEGVARNGIDTGLIWVTSICNDETEKKPFTWHWIEKA